LHTLLSGVITPQDFFYVCPAHLQDKHFCSPIIDTKGQAKRLKSLPLSFSSLLSLLDAFSRSFFRRCFSSYSFFTFSNDKVRNFPQRRSISKILCMNALTDSPCQIASIQKLTRMYLCLCLWAHLCPCLFRLYCPC
jgi:hypothetical protein